MYDLYPTGIPSWADVQRVAAHLATVQPAGAKVSVAQVVPIALTVTISNLHPATSEVVESVTEELKAMFRRRSRVAGNDVEIANMPYLATPFYFSKSWISQAIANATGEDRHLLVTPATDIYVPPGQMVILGAIVFV